MSYQGYVGLMTDYCSTVHRVAGRPVKIIEIGVDRGQTALPLIHNLISRKIDFQWVGIDIRSDDAFTQSLTQMEGVRISGSKTIDSKDNEYQLKPNVFYIIENSLDWLPVCCSVNSAAVDRRISKVDMDDTTTLTHTAPNYFDLVLLDGDHNYNTVTKELEYLSLLTHDGSLMFVDDYHGRHSGKDSFYRMYKEHEDIEHKDIETNTGREGVDNAVKDFVSSHNKFSQDKDFVPWSIRDLRTICPGGEASLITRGVIPVVQAKETMIHEGEQINILHRWCQEWHFKQLDPGQEDPGMPRL